MTGLVNAPGEDSPSHPMPVLSNSPREGDKHEARPLTASLHFVLVGFVLELLYLLVCAVAPLSTIYLHASPLATGWPWTLALSHFLFPGAWSSSSGHADLGPYFLLLGLIFIALISVYLYALNSASRVNDKVLITTRWLFLAVTGAAIFGITLLFLPSPFSNDIFSYILSGRILTIYHADPLITAPAQFQQDPYFLWISQPTMLAIYGPLWVAIASLLAAVSNNAIATLLLFKGLALLSHLINCVLIWAILAKIAPLRRLLGTLLYAWNPLALIELAGNGHYIGIVICLLLLATWLQVQQKGGWYNIGTLALLGLAISIDLVAFFFAPLLIWFIVRSKRAIARASWGFCWRALSVLAILFIVYLPFWHGASTYVAITASMDMQHFAHSPLGLLVLPFRWLFSLIAQAAHFPPNYMQPVTAADTTVLASAILIFVMIYFYLLGKVRKAPVTPFITGFDVLLASSCLAMLGFVVLVPGIFWPWYILWVLWVAALRRFDALTMSLLLLSCTALLIYPLMHLDNLPVAAYLPLLIFGLPLVYLIIMQKSRNERNKRSYDRRSETA